MRRRRRAGQRLRPRRHPQRGRASRAGRDRPAAPGGMDPHPRGGTPVPGTRVVTPNAAEAARALGARPAAGVPDAGRQARALVRRWDVASVALTFGGRGAVLAVGDSTSIYPTARSVTGDACGSGHRFASRLTTALASGALVSESVAAAVAAATEFLAAGGVATLDGRPPSPPADDDIVAAVRARAAPWSPRAAAFDLLHAGHVETLRAARRWATVGRLPELPSQVLARSRRSGSGLRGSGSAVRISASSQPGRRRHRRCHRRDVPRHYPQHPVLRHVQTRQTPKDDSVRRCRSTHGVSFLVSTKVIRDDPKTWIDESRRTTRTRGRPRVRPRRVGVPEARPAGARGSSEAVGAVSDDWRTSTAWCATSSSTLRAAETAQYSLLDRTAVPLLDRCLARGVSVVVSGVLTPQVLHADTVESRRISAVCERFPGVSSRRPTRLSQQAFCGHIRPDRGIVAGRGGPRRRSTRPAARTGEALAGSGVAALAILTREEFTASGLPGRAAPYPGL